jgi:hypothetical protein
MPKAVLRRLGVVWLAAVAVVGCGPREPRTAEERLARGRELVNQMSARLAAAAALQVTTTELRDVVRPSGAKETLSGAGVYTVRRPDRFYAKTDSRGLESWYNGKVLTLVVHPERVFAQAPMPDTINRTLDALAERYDMPLPLADLFYDSAAKALLSDSTTGGYAGTETVDGTPCHHLAFQDAGADWELWLPVDSDALPKRFKVVQKTRTGQPVIDVTFNAWNLSPQITDATFRPAVPADYEGVAVVQRAAAIKNAGSAAPTAPAPQK